MSLCIGGKLRSVGAYGQEGTFGYAFYCPGCKHTHHINTRKDPNHPNGHVWEFDGNLEKPTFAPSLLVRWTMHEPPVTPENYDQYKANPWEQTKVEKVCHSFIRSGQIQFLTDCTHELAGKTVDIPPHPSDETQN